MKALALLLLAPLAQTAAPGFVLQAQTQAPLQAVTSNPRHPGQPWIRVGARTQTLEWFDGWGMSRHRYPISTASRGLGEKEGSYQTPRGWHHVCDRIGDGADMNTIIFRQRVTPWKYTPELHEQFPNKDWILTRILWLCGDEPGLNQGGDVDSYRRYIYIHGAGSHVPWGTPSSLGCVRMRGPDVVELFELSPAGTDVLISEND